MVKDKGESERQMDMTSEMNFLDSANGLSDSRVMMESNREQQLGFEDETSFKEGRLVTTQIS